MIEHSRRRHLTQSFQYDTNRLVGSELAIGFVDYDPPVVLISLYEGNLLREVRVPLDTAKTMVNDILAVIESLEELGGG